MELAAAVLATRVDTLLRTELQLQLESSVFWTDSQSVLKYIANQHTRFHTFVANRISIIGESTEITQWHYVNTKINPADVTSRGQKADTFMENRTWIHVPEMLWKSEKDWPLFPLESISRSCVDLEVKRNAIVNTVMVTENPTGKLLMHFSSWRKLQVAVAWILKFKESLKQLVQRRKELISTLNDSNTDAQNKSNVEQKIENMKATLGGQTITKILRRQKTPSYAKPKDSIFQRK